MNKPLEKHILDIDAMMKKFLVEDPLQLLDMFMLAVDYLPQELETLSQAVGNNDQHAIRESVHSLKGGLGYLSAPQCNDLIVRWDDILRQKKLSKIDANAMLTEIEFALTQLCEAIAQTIHRIKNSGK